MNRMRAVATEIIQARARLSILFCALYRVKPTPIARIALLKYRRVIAPNFSRVLVAATRQL